MKTNIKVKTVLKYMTMLIGCFVICVLSLVIDDSYRVRAEEEIWETENNNKLETANLIDTDQKYFATIEKSRFDPDWYSFTLTDDGYIWLSFEHDYVDNDGIIRTCVYNSEGTALANIHWPLYSLAGGESSKIGLKAGTYYLRVDDMWLPDDWTGVVASYSFIVNFATSDLFEKESNNTMLEANDIQIQTKYYGSMVTPYDSSTIPEMDWYKFKVEKNGKIRIVGGIDFSVEKASDLIYQVIDTDNNRLEYERAAYPSEITVVSIDVTRGFYYVGLYSENDGDEYSFTVEFSEDGSFNDIKDNTTVKKGSKFTVRGIKYKTVDKDEVVVVGVDSALEAVKIPATVTVKKNKYAVVGISKGAFKGNKKITRVTIKADLDKIGDNAFSGCKKLKRIDLLGNISEIGRKAFYKCTNLKQIYITTENIKKIGKKAFTKTADKATVKVPAGKVNAYKKMLTKAGISKKAVVK